MGLRPGSAALVSWAHIAHLPCVPSSGHSGDPRREKTLLGDTGHAAQCSFFP